MPSHLRPDDKPVVEFDPRLEISPFALFRRLREDRAPLLFDARAKPSGLTLRGARPYPGDDGVGQPDRDIVLFDDDGSEALPVVGRLQAAGYPRARLLFGGLELYEFALDPQVVGSDTYLERLEAE